jgi:hypothetical protein
MDNLTKNEELELGKLALEKGFVVRYATDNEPTYDMNVDYDGDKRTITIEKEYFKENGIPMLKRTLKEDGIIFFERICKVSGLKDDSPFNRLDEMIRYCKDPSYMDISRIMGTFTYDVSDIDDGFGDLDDMDDIKGPIIVNPPLTMMKDYDLVPIDD